MQKEVEYMRRALQLARNGEGFTSPNPMVGAVIVAPDGRVIGEGWHRCYGGPHAEVNAVASVSGEDQHLIPESTIYVTLEPCSHYGKTPPCAKLLVEKRFRRVVVAMLDPNPKVAGRGIAMLQEAGIEVETGLLEDEAIALNKRFYTAHTEHRPWIQLKWAQSLDGYIASVDAAGNPHPVQFSSPLPAVWMHRERANVDAIMVGTTTANTDNPSLTVRLWPSRRSPIPITFDRHGSLKENLTLRQREDLILVKEDQNLPELCHRLYAEHGITSLMVEGGAKLLNSFIEAELFDEVRVEYAPINLGHGVPAPNPIR